MSDINIPSIGYFGTGTNPNALQNVPQAVPVNQGAALQQGMINASSMRAQQAATNQQQQATALDRMGAINKIAGSVHFAAPDQQPQAYQQGLQYLKSQGISTQGAPASWESGGREFTEQAYNSSGMAMANLTAQAQMATAAAGTDINRQNANTNAAGKNLPQPFTGPSAVGQVNNMFDAAGRGVPGQGAPQQGVPQPQGSAPQQGSPIGANVSGQPGQLGYNPFASNAAGQGPIAMATATEDQKDFASQVNKAQVGAQSYDTNKATLAQAEAANNSGIIPSGPGILGKMRDYTPGGGKLEEATANIQKDVATGLAQAGMGRGLRAMLGMIEESTPGNDKYQSVNQASINTLRAKNEIANNIAPAILSDLKNKGATSMSQAGPIIAETIKRAQIFDPKTGEVNQSNLSKWQSAYASVIRDAYQGKSGSFIKEPSPEQLDSAKFVGSDGKTYTGEDVLDKAASAHQTPMQIMQGLGLKPASSTAGNTTNNAQNQYKPIENTPENRQQVIQQLKATNPNIDDTAAGQILEKHNALIPKPQAANTQTSAVNGQTNPDGIRLANALAPQESGGKYTAIGPTVHNGDQALGKYQIMASNVPAWTKEVLGQSMTPQQFLANPQAQDQVAQAKLQQYHDKYKNDSDALSTWFSGRPMANNSSKDALGTSVPQYVAKANQTMLAQNQPQQQIPKLNTPSPGDQGLTLPTNQYEATVRALDKGADLAGNQQPSHVVDGVNKSNGFMAALSPIGTANADEMPRQDIKTQQQAFKVPADLNTGVPLNPEYAKTPAVQQAMNAYQQTVQKGLTKSPIVAIVDYSQPSTAKRMTILNAQTGKVLLQTEVAHGAGSGSGANATQFSNEPNSHESSLGTFLADTTYSGKHGYSMRVRGLDKGVNDNVYSRDVVVHGASYIGNGQTGHSFGCFAVPQNMSKQVINLLKDRAVIYAYGTPSQ